MVSDGFWSEVDDKAERREAVAEARAAAMAREEAVIDLPSVLRLASRAVDNLVRGTLNADGMSQVSLMGLDILGLTRQARPVVGGWRTWSRILLRWPTWTGAAIRGTGGETSTSDERERYSLGAGSLSSGRPGCSPPRASR